MRYAIASIAIFLTSYCHHYTVIVSDQKDPGKEIKVPLKARPSGFHDDEPLTQYCDKGTSLNRATFFLNGPRTVLCK